MSILPFDFEGATIRVVLDESGEPLFVAKDVCAALGLSNVSQALSRIDAEDITSNDALTSGGVQSVAHVNESGLYALVLGSKLEAAKKFKRWITKDVLPSIRRTGSYTKPDTASPLKLATECAHQALVLAGVRPTLASAAMLKVIEGHTGVPMEPARLMLPADTKPLASLNATALGKAIGLSAVKTNRLLLELGYQTKNERNEWVPTALGSSAGGEMIAFDNHGHQGLQLRWPTSFVDVLKSRAA